MIQFIADSPNGPVLGVGLSFGNLDRITVGDPALVKLSEHGGAGRIVLASVSRNEDLAPLMAQFPGDFVVGLTQRTVDSLRSGEAIELGLAQLGVPNFHAGILFAGPTEFEIVNTLRASGFVSADTPLTGLDEYLRHERNVVEDCASCRARTHQKTGGPNLALPSAPRSTPWLERLYAHPYLAAVGLLGLFALIGLAVSLAKISPYR